MALGRLHEAVSTLEQLLQFVVDQGEPMPPDTADLYRGLGELYRERGDLEAAAQYLLRSKELGEQAELPGLAVSSVRRPGSPEADPGRPGWRSRPAGRSGAPVCQDPLARRASHIRIEGSDLGYAGQAGRSSGVGT